MCADPAGCWLLVASHEHGSVAVLPIDGEGTVGPLADLRRNGGTGPGSSRLHQPGARRAPGGYDGRGTGRGGGVDDPTLEIHNMRLVGAHDVGGHDGGGRM